MALSSAAPIAADQCPVIADIDHEIPAGTYTVLFPEPSYVLGRPRAEDLLLAEWERDQAVKALESQNNSDFPWMPVLLVTGAALVIGFATGAVVAHELAKPKNSS